MCGLRFSYVNQTASFFLFILLKSMLMIALFFCSAFTINALQPCLAAQSIQLGINDIVVSGGMESMSNVPKYIAEASEPEAKPMRKLSMSLDPHIWRMTLLYKALSVVLLPEITVPSHGKSLLLKFLAQEAKHQISLIRMPIWEMFKLDED
uniref:uncharacterized protein LOC122596292 n=1 Tax=Erigeron canadensis TaxID=72917 RepID=UPI001CB892E1|nr:uncharacterized protein LOC122596292 [Erigeron canadensis]